MNEFDDINNEVLKFVEKQTEKYPGNRIMSALSAYLATISGYTLENEEQIVSLFDTLKLHSLEVFKDEHKITYT